MLKENSRQKEAYVQPYSQALPFQSSGLVCTSETPVTAALDPIDVEWIL